MLAQQRLRGASRLLRLLPERSAAAAEPALAAARACTSLAGTSLASPPFSRGGTALRGTPPPPSSRALCRGFAAAALPPHSHLDMPALSPTMSHGNIVSWKKKEGDAVAPGDIYCEVETDKATIEWESQEEGFLARILAPEGTKDIPLGTPVAVLVEEESDISAFANYSPGAAAEAPSAAPAAPPPAASSAGSSFPGHDVLSMPSLSPTMTQGNIIAWKKKEGDEVAPGDILAEVETDKATIEWEAQEEGFIAKILVAGGTQGIDVGAPVIVLVEDKGDVSAFASFTAGDVGGGGKPAAAEAEAAPPPPATPKQQQQQSSAPRSQPQSTVAPGDRIIASPYARKLAAEADVSLAGTAGSGPGGRIVADDVRRLVASGGAAPATAAAPTTVATFGADYVDIPTTQIRKVVARRLLESKQQVPHYYLTISCRVDTLMAVRAQLNEQLAATDKGAKISINDFVIKAASMAMRRVPEVNASWQGDFIRQFNNIDCTVAVQTPAGLMVPVVRDSDRKGLSQIAAEVRSLAGKAKEGKLGAEDMAGGTFTISNLGMFGVNQFAAIVNPPQAAILAVGGTESRVVTAKKGGFEEAAFMTVTLSCDHRVVDGAVGAQWLAAFKGYLESPASMLL